MGRPPGSWEGFIDGENKVLNTLVMGTFVGAVDYLTTKKIRSKAYPTETNLNWGFINRYMTDFGYTDAERLALETMDPTIDSLGRGLADAGSITTRDDVDAKIAGLKAGSATQADVLAVIKEIQKQWCINKRGKSTMKNILFTILLALCPGLVMAYSGSSQITASRSMSSV